MTSGDGSPPSQARVAVEPVVVDRLQAHLGPLAGISPATVLLDELGLDSIGLVTILLDLADEFNLDLSSSTLSGVDTVGDLVRMVEQLLGTSSGAG